MNWGNRYSARQGWWWKDTGALHQLPNQKSIPTGWANDPTILPEPVTHGSFLRHLQRDHQMRTSEIATYLSSITINDLMRQHFDSHSGEEEPFSKATAAQIPLGTNFTPDSYHAHVMSPIDTPRPWDIATHLRTRLVDKKKLKGTGVSLRHYKYYNNYYRDYATEPELFDAAAAGHNPAYYLMIRKGGDINDKMIDHKTAMEALKYMPYKRGMFPDQQYYTRNLWSGVGPTAVKNRELNRQDGRGRPEYGMTHEEVLDRFAKRSGLSGIDELREKYGESNS